MKVHRNIPSVLAIILFFASVSAQAQTKVKLDKSTSSTQFYAVEDLRPGMKGVARSVFSGSDPEEFQLEILGVLDGFTGPRQSTA